MKYLKIENNKGLYFNGSEYEEIDKINREGLLAILEAAGSDDFEIEPFDANILANKAHQIIYENIYDKLVLFLDDKDQFKNEVDRLYKKAVDDYSAGADEECETTPNNTTTDSDINIEDNPI
jgi:hypothetical protein